MNIFGMGGMEILVILLVAFLVVGPTKMITMSRKMGKTFGEIRRSTANLSDMIADLEEEVSEGEKKRPAGKRDTAAASADGTSPSASVEGDGPVPFSRAGGDPESKAPPPSQA